MRPSEFKIVRLRECAMPSNPADTPEKLAAYCRDSVTRSDWWRDEQECLVVILFNTRCRILGHHLISIGGLDSCPSHAREIMRPVIIHAAAAFAMMHNHPSGDPTPSMEDIRQTRQIHECAKLFRTGLTDHIILGHPSPEAPAGYASLRELGYIS